MPSGWTSTTVPMIGTATDARASPALSGDAWVAPRFDADASALHQTRPDVLCGPD
jgi:hypothetical protein